MSAEERLLLRWRRLVKEDAAAWKDGPPYWFFHRFRPDGRGIDKVFEGIDEADEIQPRLLEVYQATASGWRNDDSVDAYFIVRKPEHTSSRALQELARAHLEKVASIARSMKNPGVARRLIKARVRIDATGASPPEPSDLDSEVYEMLGEFTDSVRPLGSSPALLLEQPSYGLACDYNLAAYVLWPAYRKPSPVEEPFGPYFELWKHGLAHLRLHEGTAIFTMRTPARPGE